MNTHEEKAILVSLAVTAAQKLDAADSMAELEGLARAAGAEVVHKVFQSRPSPTAKFFIGPGKVEEIRRIREELGAGP